MTTTQPLPERRTPRDLQSRGRFVAIARGGCHNRSVLPLLLRTIALAVALMLSGMASLLAVVVDTPDACCPGEAAEEDDADGPCCFACADCAHVLFARPLIASTTWMLPAPTATDLHTASPLARGLDAQAGVDDDVFHPPRA